MAKLRRIDWYLMSVLIRGGRVVTGSSDFVGDILIEGEQISEVGIALDVPDAEVIDAAGKLVLPGGVDPHVHFEMPMGNQVTCDDFTSGTRAAAHGGTTTVIDFAKQGRGESVVRAYDEWMSKLEAHPPMIDVGFHMILSGVRASLGKEMLQIRGEGVSSAKMFMAYPGELMLNDEELFWAMETCVESGVLPMVHAENGGVVQALTGRALREGRLAAKYHSTTRPAAVEDMAVYVAIKIAEMLKTPLYFVHLSSGEAMRLVSDARLEGIPIFGETCPQYLFLDDSVYSGGSADVAKFVFTPPARSVAHQEKLWRGLAANVLSVVSTDHCPFCMVGQKSLAVDFAQIPNGAPGVESRLLLLYGAVLEGRISLSRMVELFASGPAKIFGLYPRKGCLSPRSDADVTILDPSGSTTLSAEWQESTVDYCLFEGLEVSGKIDTVISRGRVVVRNGCVVGPAGHGRYIRRGECASDLL